MSGEIQEKEVQPSRKMDYALLISLSINLFFLLVFAFSFVNVKEAEEATCAVVGEKPITDSIFVHYVLHKDGELFYKNIVENGRGELSFLSLKMPLEIGATYEIEADCIGITIKAKIGDIEEAKPKPAINSPAHIARGFHFRNLL